MSDCRQFVGIFGNYKSSILQKIIKILRTIHDIIRLVQLLFYFLTQ